MITSSKKAKGSRNEEDSEFQSPLSVHGKLKQHWHFLKPEGFSDDAFLVQIGLVLELFTRAENALVALKSQALQNYSQYINKVLYFNKW